MYYVSSVKAHLVVKSFFMVQVTYNRAKHVIAETKRCEDAAEAFLASDFAGFGKLMVESHVSLRSYFSC